MANGKNLGVDGKRLWDALMDMANIGGTEKGGCNRQALTDLDKEGRDLFVTWCKQAGCTIKVDRMGNIFARRSGKDDSLSPVMMGSHLDTQPTGGKFDGVYGVLAGLEVVRSLNDLGYETERPMEIAVWTNEEGTRFPPAMIASGVFAGVFDLEYGLSREDRDGMTIEGELERIGYNGTEEVGGRDIYAFFEVHIEQGPILEDAEKTIGVVTDAQGLMWYDVTLIGQEAHAGPTPMPLRKDALLGAARITETVNRIAVKNAPYGCGTVGFMDVYPNSRNVIPGHVSMTVDIRHPDQCILDQMHNTFVEAVEKIAFEGGLELKIDRIFQYYPVHFDEGCVETVRTAAVDCGFSMQDIVSGAGHDACYISRIAPSSMIFVPCVGGISHNEVEDAKPEWITAGANVLLRAALEKAGHKI